MKLLASVRSSALQRPSIIACTHFHIPLTCHCSSPAQSYSQLYPSTSSSSSPSSPCSQSNRRFSTRNSVLHNSPKSPSPPPPEPSLSRDVRLLMRRVPHPVAIITTSTDSASSSNTNTNPNQNPTTKSTPRGMTVSSFNTVTLHPKPVISFNVHHPSETLLALQSSSRFLVHLLAPGAAAARLARDFARGNENLDLGEFEWDYHKYLPRLRRRRQQQQSQEEEGEKHEREDFSFVLECQYIPDKTIQVYDHIIVLGTVEKVLAASPRSSTDIQERDDFCLTYADTRFWKMGEQVE